MSEAEIILYVRDECTLCDEAEATLRAILAARGEGALKVIDVTADESLHRRLVAEIPAIEIDGQLLPHASGRLRIERFLDEAGAWR